jgi:hypothetical protein
MFPENRTPRGVVKSGPCPGATSSLPRQLSWALLTWVWVVAWSRSGLVSGLGSVVGTAESLEVVGIVGRSCGGVGCGRVGGRPGRHGRGGHRGRLVRRGHAPAGPSDRSQHRVRRRFAPAGASAKSRRRVRRVFAPAGASHRGRGPPTFVCATRSPAGLCPTWPAWRTWRVQGVTAMTG